MSDPIITSPGLYPDFNEEIYHADPCVTPSLSSGAANTIIKKSPMHCHYSHPRLGGTRRVPTDAMIFGSIVHKLLLGKGSDIDVLDADSWRGKDAGNFWDQSLLLNHLPCLTKTMDKAMILIESAKIQLDSFGLSKVFEDNEDAQSEVAGFWKEEDSWCRLLIDRRVIDRKENRCHMYDIKTMGQGASIRQCQARITAMGYDLQEAHYKQGNKVLCPEFTNRTSFTFIFIETTAPFAVTPFPIDDEWKGIGEKHRIEALSKWRECMATNKWPAYVEKIEPVPPPKWLSWEEMEDIET